MLTPKMVRMSQVYLPPFQNIILVSIKALVILLLHSLLAIAVEMSKLGIYRNSRKGSFPEKFSEEI